MWASNDKFNLGEEPGTDQAGGHYSRKTSLPSQEFADQVLLLISLQVLR